VSPKQRGLHPQSSWAILALLLATGACASACGGASESDADPESTDADQANAPEPLREVDCIDQSIAQLMLFEAPAPGRITSARNADDSFETGVDATAGGMKAVESFVYGRFTDKGLEKVEIGDEDAFASLGWDIAFRRYVIRLNSGISGPGSVTGARTLPETAFETLAIPPEPEVVPYRTEAYFTSSCDYVNDGSGIGSPGTALASFWKYQGCVQMTGNVFVLALHDERHVKLEVMSYYTPEQQRKCDMTGMVPSPSGAGNLRIRWAFLD
jgi:hypothetical protein